MSDRPATPHPSTEASDAKLIASVRAGDSAAYEVLYSRHRKAAAACARRFASREADVDDLVAEAFANVLAVLRKGAGPTEFYRAYLLRTIQHCAFRSTREQQRTVLTDVWHSNQLAEPMRDAVTEAFDSRAVGEAFKSLPERWQAVLWHTEVEGETPTVIGRLLGLRPNSVSALAYRAREGLRIAYIQAHITTMPDEACRKHAAKLGAYTRDKLSPTETALVQEHLDNCEHCKSLYLELADVSSSIRTAVVPLFLGPAAATYLLRTPGHVAQAHHTRILHEAKWTSGKALIGTATAGVVLGAGALALTLSGTHHTAGHNTYAGTVEQLWAPGKEPSPSTSPSDPSASPTLPRQRPVADAPTAAAAESPGAIPAPREPTSPSAWPARHDIRLPARVTWAAAAPTADATANRTVGPTAEPAPSDAPESASPEPSTLMSTETANPRATPPPSKPAAPRETRAPSESASPTASTAPRPARSGGGQTHPLPSTTVPPTLICWGFELDGLSLTIGTRCSTTTPTRLIGRPLLEARPQVTTDRDNPLPVRPLPTRTPSPHEPSAVPAPTSPPGTTKR
ncbi:sigma-70 family RNA polymerase sigma factor [Streptomyces nigrescens]|uniref:Sigma-70 family RNA polymerase sigma factor n=1 Tax=Streptomyces nigrescens TaxID=1920 RepID=A0ABY7IXN0_STRNI|nr:sigma-70 family RNA polymerase sigma factor [Streptomyces nigrescens]WAU03749.1 sigma-70 family RNA polymerase sigma factor [Streptomyces nigrescens]